MAKHRSHMRSLQRALHKDDAGRRITAPIVGPLFASEPLMATRQAESTEPSMFYAASPIIQSSQLIAIFCTRSA